ncbi:hypothetical protein ALC57_12408 [Trachymyrmex cornetzi]|uniref:Uncharacterized protein n=1 Tax=Trachymyrmex cornetzi TaxID=471704 RepID=A0A195DS63_9HYME|nr:hypothetical protein ALC57_12408 [Trachymyrmex cornetzi]
MKLSVCRVVIIANRKVDNAVWGRSRTDNISNVTGVMSVLLPSVAIVELEGKFALHAQTSFSSRST